MEVNLILIAVCEMLEKDTLAAKLKLDERTLTDAESAEVALFSKCLNFVLNEVATEYCPLIFKEEISTSDGQFDLTSLSKTIAYVKSLKSKNGSELKYKIYGDKLSFFEGNAVIEYCYVPEEVSVDGEIELTIPARVIAYGVLREYYLLKDMPTEASFFEERFKNSLVVFARKKSEIKMPKRIWK